jgi:RND family efflux transporter MFP subunit
MFTTPLVRVCLPGRRPAAVLAANLLLPLFVACSPKAAETAPAKPAAAAKPAKPLLQVQTVAAAAADLPATLELTGSLTADLQSEVAAAVPGIVREVLVDVGSRVKQGDVLVRQDDRDGTLRQAQAVAATAQASARLGVVRGGEHFSAQRVPEVQVAKDMLQLAETELARAKALVEGGSAAQSVLDQAKARVEQSRGQYEAAINGAKASWAAVKAAEAAENISKKAIADTDVRAPFAGVIQERRVSPGEYAGPGKVLVLLVRDNPIRVKVDLPEAEAALAVVGGEALVRVAAFPDRIFAGKIVRVAAALKAQSRALPLEIEVANDSGELKAGFFARVVLIRPGQPKAAVVVAPAAVGTTGSAARVFVVEGGALSERIVAVGRTWQGQTEILGNLKAGEQVVVGDHSQLEDGRKVQSTPSAGIALPAAATATP